MPSPRLRHEAIFLLVFAPDLVNMFIATVAYPALAAELHADVGTLARVGTAYMLGLSVVIPLAPWLAARCGERRLLLVALLLFAVAAVLAGAAPGIGWLLGWRLLQGLAGGLLIPVAQAAAYRQCTSDQRGALTRRILLVALLVPALAPALGGLLVQWLSGAACSGPACRWRWWRSAWCWPGCRPMARAVRRACRPMRCPPRCWRWARCCWR